MSKTNWKKEIEKVSGTKKEDKIIHSTLSEEELTEEFYSGYGGSNGKPFTAWSETYVYFPVVYDGAEWVGRVRRNPCEEASGHHGGE